MASVGRLGEGAVVTLAEVAGLLVVLATTDVEEEAHLAACSHHRETETILIKCGSRCVHVEGEVE